MRTNIKLTFVLSLIAVTSMAIGCVSEGTSDDDVLEPGIVEDEYTEAIPDQDMLTMALDESGDFATTSQALTEDGEPGANEYSRLRRHTVEVLTGINNLRRDTHKHVRNVIEHAQVKAELVEDGKTCKMWITDGPNNRWQLTSCKVDARARKFAFVLRGKPLASDSDDDYLPVFAGEAIAAPRHNGVRRGKGLVAYDFDNISTLSGEEIQGKLAIAYKANGPARQLNIGLKEVAPGDAQPYSALYRFNHLIGRGGSFHYLTVHDFLTRDDLGEIVEGMDGIDERARIAVAWTVGGAGRTAHAVCGGTLGERCYRVYQCWQADGQVSWQEILDGDGEPNWERTSCGDVPFDVDEPMGEDELSEPNQNDDGSIEVPEPDDTL